MKIPPPAPPSELPNSYVTHALLLIAALILVLGVWLIVLPPHISIVQNPYQIPFFISVVTWSGLLLFALVCYRRIFLSLVKWCRSLVGFCLLLLTVVLSYLLIWQVFDTLNQRLDHSPEQMVETMVGNKQLRRLNGMTYHYVFIPLKHHQFLLLDNKTLYDLLELDEPLTVTVKKGLFNQHYVTRIYLNRHQQTYTCHYFSEFCHQ